MDRDGVAFIFTNNSYTASVTVSKPPEICGQDHTRGLRQDLYFSLISARLSK